MKFIQYNMPKRGRLRRQPRGNRELAKEARKRQQANNEVKSSRRESVKQIRQTQARVKLAVSHDTCEASSQAGCFA
ncbi:hypothetical protein WN943_016438 [Citrus x changshan-huyou]